MNRIALIKAIINRKNTVQYLEIGVSSGRTFFQIKADNKTAVDPKFRFGLAEKIISFFKNPSNINNRYFEITSDAFFSQQADSLSKTGLDVVLIDGLHSYEQALVDVENTLKHLNPGGVIVMHDCNPATEAVGCPANSKEEAKSRGLPGWTGGWCGDVWKAICYLRASRNDINVFVFDCDHGLGIVTKGEPEKPIELTAEDVPQLTYQDLEKNREAYLNLKPADQCRHFIDSIGS